MTTTITAHIENSLETCTWVGICQLGDIDFDRGVASLVDGIPVAVFRLRDSHSGTGELYALDHIDPRTGTPTIARGMVGSAGDVTYVAAPLHKHRYDIRTGACLDDDARSLRSYPVRAHGSVVEVRTVVTAAKHGGNTHKPDS